VEHSEYAGSSQTQRTTESVNQAIPALAPALVSTLHGGDEEPGSWSSRKTNPEVQIDMIRMLLVRFIVFDAQ
jgi:hypothetical protein